MTRPSGRQPFPLAFYGAVSALLTPAAPLILASRSRRGKENNARIAERRGRPSRSRPEGRLAWLHGASVGEVVSLLPVVERLVARGLSVLVTSGTNTSAQLLAKRLPPGAFHQFMPLDIPSYQRRFLDHWRPDIALIVESELWPNMLRQAALRDIPLILVNARMSERSFRRWRRFPKAAAALLGQFDLCLAQSQGDAQRLGELGALRVSVAGNLKFDVPALPADLTTLAAMSGLVAGRPVWIAASTHPGEEEIAVEVHARLFERMPNLLTIIMPRHVERGAQIAQIAAADGFLATRRALGEAPERQVSIYVADTMGEAGLFYRLAPIAFVGGTLAPVGGHNPIEPAKLGTAILHGPHVHNATDIYAVLDAASAALPVGDGEELAVALGELLVDPARTRAMARAASATVDGLGGAVQRTLLAVEPYLMSFSLETRR